MKNLKLFILVMFFAAMLVSCAKSSAEPANGMINPGDKIGDFLITTGKEGDVTYSWDLECKRQGREEIYTCESTVGTKVNVSMGVYAAFSSKDLDTLWSEHTYQMFINDRPVNLEAFGSIDVVHPQVGKMRHWNVVIVADKPGEIRTRDSGVVDGDPYEATTTYTFSAP